MTRAARTIHLFASGERECGRSILDPSIYKVHKALSSTSFLQVLHSPCEHSSDLRLPMSLCVTSP